jgi:hypothetical protein
MFGNLKYCTYICRCNDTVVLFAFQWIYFAFQWLKPLATISVIAMRLIRTAFVGVNPNVTK